jgi:hypothetical protein
MKIFGRSATSLFPKGSLLMFLSLSTFQFGVNAQAQTLRDEHYSPKQLRLLEANAASPADYQKLATYFHHQELLFRTKAQQALDEYANHTGKYPMATKFVSRAEVVARLRDHYLSKADDNAKAAERYHEKLTQLGFKPASESATITSVNSLQNAPSSTPGSALMETSRSTPAGGGSNPVEH